MFDTKPCQFFVCSLPTYLPTYLPRWVSKKLSFAVGRSCKATRWWWTTRHTGDLKRPKEVLQRVHACPAHTKGFIPTWQVLSIENNLVVFCLKNIVFRYVLQHSRFSLHQNRLDHWKMWKKCLLLNETPQKKFQVTKKSSWMILLENLYETTAHKVNKNIFNRSSW